MRGGYTQRAQYVGSRRSGASVVEKDRRRSVRTRDHSRRPAPRPVGNRVPRRSRNPKVYKRRRLLAVSLALLSALVVVVVAFAQTSGAEDQALPIDPNNAETDTVLAEVAGLSISSPVRPEEITGLGYHPEGESLIEMSPRGENLSANAFLGLLTAGSTPEKIRYHVMPAGSRLGSRTGALDVGAEVGTTVYSPVNGTVVAIRPDPVLQEGAKVVEIKPVDAPELRVSVSLVGDIDGEIGPKSPVTAGMTALGSVADSAKVLKPQLAGYTSGSGNHVTVSVSRVD